MCFFCIQYLSRGKEVNVGVHSEDMRGAITVQVIDDAFSLPHTLLPGYFLGTISRLGHYWGERNGAEI